MEKRVVRALLFIQRHAATVRAYFGIDFSQGILVVARIHGENEIDIRVIRKIGMCECTYASARRRRIN